MKRLLVLLVVLLVLVVPAGVSAHELASDAGVSAVLHIPPDDNPRAGQLVDLSFDFSSRQTGFDLRSCGCVVSVQTTPDRLQTVSIDSTFGSRDQGVARLTFPEAGVYQVAVRGLVASGSTQHFNFSYRLRVTAATSDAGRRQAGLQVLLLGATSLVLLVLGARALISRGQRYTQARRA